MTEGQALAMARNRDRLRVLVLEAERSMGMPAPFDWRRWRISRFAVESQAREDWRKQPYAHVIHRLGTR